MTKRDIHDIRQATCLNCGLDVTNGVRCAYCEDLRWKELTLKEKREEMGGEFGGDGPDD